MKKYFSNKNSRQIFFITMSFFLSILIFANFFILLYDSKKNSFVPSCFFNNNLQGEPSSHVGNFTSSNNEGEAKVINYLNDLYKTRNNSFLNGNVENLYKYYNKNETFSRYSLLHEFKRIAFLRDWANERDITLSNISSTPKILALKVKDNTYSLVIREEYKFDYYYNSKKELVNNFGIAIIHNLELEEMGSSFIVSKDYYLDCFEGGLKNYDFNLGEKDLPITKYKTYNLNFNVRDTSHYSSKYNNKKAAYYANKYCGISWANNSSYNPSYHCYSAGCGNCTNFISQCISDTKEGGNLKQDRKWVYKENDCQEVIASNSWVDCEEFAKYLISSNKAKVAFCGNFYDMISRMKSYAIDIKLGDIVIYKNNNSIEHTAIITNFDSNGYPLVNSNCIDKYQVPFDLGTNNTDSQIILLSMF